MSYDVACIRELKEDASELVQQQNQAKVFRMCIFQAEQLKMDLKCEFNQDLAQFKQTDFNTIVQTGTGLERTRYYSITSFMASTKSSERKLTHLLIR